MQPFDVHTRRKHQICVTGSKNLAELGHFQWEKSLYVTRRAQHEALTVFYCPLQLLSELNITRLLHYSTQVSLFLIFFL